MMRCRTAPLRRCSLLFLGNQCCRKNSALNTPRCRRGTSRMPGYSRTRCGMGQRRLAMGCYCGWRPPEVIVPPMLPVAACGRPSEILVERVPAVTPMDFERRYRRASKPVVFTDLIPKWKAWRRWSHKYFHDVWGEHKVPVLPTRGNLGQYNPSKGYVFPEMRMADAVDRLQQGGHESVYVMVPLDRYMRAL